MASKSIEKHGRTRVVQNNPFMVFNDYLVTQNV